MDIGDPRIPTIFDLLGSISTREVVNEKQEISGLSVKLLTIRAEEGDAVAQAELGWRLYEGRGCPRDYVVAAAWMQRAADQENSDALNRLGICHENGRGVPRNTVKARELFERAIKAGNVKAAVNLAELLRTEVSGVAQDHLRSRELVAWAAAKGLSRAVSILGVYEECGVGAPPNVDQAIRLYREAAELGEAGALVNLSLLYEDEAARRPREGIVVELLQQAAERGDARGMSMLAVKYAEGEGVDKDLVRAEQLFRAAAETGDADAQYILACELLEGRLLEADNLEGMRWLNAAADQVHPDALFELGRRAIAGKLSEQLTPDDLKLLLRSAELDCAEALVLVGRILSHRKTKFRDKQRALEYFRRASALGDSSGHFWLGVALLDQARKPTDYQEGRDCLRKAAEQGDRDAQHLLGVSLARKEHGEIDLVEAESWLRMAVENGDGRARSSLRRIRMARLPYWKWRVPVSISIGAAFLIVHTVNRGFDFDVQFFGLYLSIQLIGMLILVSIVLVAGWKWDVADALAKETEADVELLMGTILRKPWRLLQLPAEDGFFLLPLLYLGISPLSALIAALGFGFIHYPEKPARTCWVISIIIFFIALFVLPYGIWTVIAGHATLDLSLLAIWGLTHRDRFLKLLNEHQRPK